jgi:uncharacterized membrane protein
MGIGAELRAALAAAAPYMLSHHVPAQRHRCYAPVIFGRRVRLCARCSGVYPGIAAGLVSAVVGPAVLVDLRLVAVLPLPALVDWAVTSFTPRRGTNSVRTLTGLLLGYGYGLGLTVLVSGPRLPVLGIGVGYAVVAGLLVSCSETVA